MALRLTPIAPNPAGSFEALYAVAPDDTMSSVARELPHAWEQAPDTAVRTLRILHFNDLHNHLQGVGEGSVETPILSSIVRCYRERRRAAPADEVVLLLSGGDDHTGSPLDELLGWNEDEFVIDPAYAAYSAAGVDVAALGNHDLDRGSGVLAAGIRRDAKFPILSANLRGATSLCEGRDFHPAVVGVAKGLRIGFLGLTTPIDTRLGTAHDSGLEVVARSQPSLCGWCRLPTSSTSSSSCPTADMGSMNRRASCHRAPAISPKAT